MTESAAQLAAGSVIGGTYEAVHQIGRGGMGEVWLARHLRLPKQVAIKVLHTRGAPLTDDALARFRREAEIASRLGHPNIVEVHDFNTLPSGDPYLVLELLEGEPLSRRLKRGPLSYDEAKSVVRQVGSALQAAHHLGVVHRDLKPDNIFLVPSPLGGLRVKVLDFGISKFQDSNSVLTQEAVLVGTPQYMSPEQATGANKDVGPQADVFAMGAITYELLCGESAFSGESVAQVVFRVAYESHRPLAERVGPEVPATAVQAVERALLKDRARRTPDIGALVVEFTGEPITLSPGAPVPPAPQLAVLSTPSMDLSASLGVADTHASTGKGTPPPADRGPFLATPSPPTRAPEKVASTSGTRPVEAAPSTTSSSAGRYRVVVQWVGSAAAVLLVVLGGYQLLLLSPQADALAGDDARAPAAASLQRKAMPAQVESVEPSEPERPAEAPPPPPPPPPPPVKPAQLRQRLNPEESARLKDLEAFATARGSKPVELEVLVRKYAQLSGGVTRPFALDLMRETVALAACRQRDDRVYFLYRDQIESPGIKAELRSLCAPR